MSAKKIPANLIPVGLAPNDVVTQLVALEREAEKVQREGSRKIQEIAERVEELLDKFRQDYGLTSKHVVHTPTGYVVVAYSPQETLNDAPDLPILKPISSQ